MHSLSLMTEEMQWMLFMPLTAKTVGGLSYHTMGRVEVVGYDVVVRTLNAMNVVSLAILLGNAACAWDHEVLDVDGALALFVAAGVLVMVEGATALTEEGLLYADAAYHHLHIAVGAATAGLLHLAMLAVFHPMPMGIDARNNRKEVDG